METNTMNGAANGANKSAAAVKAIPAVIAYDGPDVVPPAAGWPLNKALWEPFVDAAVDNILTFTALVPLDILLNGRDSVSQYLDEAFDGTVFMEDVEYRVIGGGVDGGGWDSHEDGDVALQVSCTLSSK